MRILSFIAPVALSLSLSACVATIPPVEVTRFHLGQAIAPGAVMVESLNPADSHSLEFRTYAAAVSKAMAGAGLSTGEGGATPYIAAIDVTRDTRAAVRKRSPITIGIGGGTGGWSGGGVGLGASFGLGGSGARETVISRLSVRLMKRNDRAVVWEGRAQTESPSTAPAAQPGLAAEKLATALFKNFPGESGKTVLVP
jgi:hypothetical protein